MSRTILLVDDHEDNRLALMMVLQRVGYRAIGAENGLEALEVVRAERPDLVLMDLAMPVMGGRDAMRAIRADPEIAATPIVALTAMALSVDRAALIEEGFDGLLIKPCMPPVLIAEVRRIVGEP
jgi:two-component system, cell cycle response regulator DivK